MVRLNYLKKGVIMKHIYLLILFNIQLFALGGIGLNFNQSLYSVDENITHIDGSVVYITQGKFENGLGVGGYLYIDAIPVIDIDIEGHLLESLYDFSFNNSTGGPGNNLIPQQVNEQLAWGSASGYITAQKKIFKLSIPFLAKAKLSAGGGINFHVSTPMVDEEMLKSITSNVNLSSVDLDTEDLIDYLNDNKISSSGFHIQAGVQFKVLALDSFLFYRYVFVD